MSTFISATLTRTGVIIVTREGNTVKVVLVPSERFTEDLSLITKTDIQQMKRAELTGFQQALGAYLGTGQDKKARQLNQLIIQEKDRRDNYGF
jgi:hypothetical protein